MTDCPHSSEHTPSNPLSGRESDHEVHDQLEAIVETYDGAPDVCTLFPRPDTDTATATTWISAEEGSFVALEDVR